MQTAARCAAAPAPRGPKRRNPGGPRRTYDPVVAFTTTRPQGFVWGFPEKCLGSAAPEGLEPRRACAAVLVVEVLPPPGSVGRLKQERDRPDARPEQKACGKDEPAVFERSRRTGAHEEQDEDRRPHLQP